MTVANIMTKLAGLGGLYLIGTDAHGYGIAGKNKNPQTQVAKCYPNMVLDAQRLTSDTLMVPTGKLKNAYLNYWLEDTTFPAWHAFTGYVSYFTKSLVNNVIPLSLSVGALAFSKSDKFSKAGANLTRYSAIKKHGGKLCAALLAIGAAKMFICDICGMGDYKKI